MYIYKSAVCRNISVSMVVSVLIITCFLKLATCNPYVSSISSTKLPAITHEAHVSPKDINVGWDLRPKYSYGYIPQGITQPVEDTKPSNANRRSMGITPLNIMPKQNMPVKVIPDNYVNFNEATPITTEPKTIDLDDHPEISKNPNEVSTTKYQHKPFSKTFNNFRENLLKTIDLDLKSKSRTTSPLKNVKTHDAAAINQEATFVEPQIKTMTTQPIKLTDNLPQVLPNNYNIFSGLENERTKVEVLLPDDAGEFKDYTFDAENIPANRAQVSRVPYYSNNNPFFQISKENKFGKSNPKGQQQEIKYNTSNVQQQTKMQPLKIPPYKPQENSSYFTAIVPTNQNLLPPYNEERNLTHTLRIPNQNQVNSIDSEVLYSQPISDSETIRENQFKTDPRTLQVPIFRMPYYQNSKSLFQPSQNNESLQENLIVTMDPSNSSKLNIHNTSPSYSFADKIIPLAQPNFTNLNLEENISEVSNPGIIFNPSTKEENISYAFKAPYYNNFYQPYTRAFAQQLFPRNHSSTLNQLEKVDPQHSEERNVIEKAHIAANPQEINSVVASPETIITTEQTSNNEDENILQNFAPPYYNLYRPYSRSFNQQIKPENQSLKHEDNARKPYSMNIPVDRNVPKKSQTLPTNPEIIPSESPEVVYQPENLHNDTENMSKTLQTTHMAGKTHYNNNEFYQPFSRAHSQQLMPRNHSPKLNQQEKAEPQNKDKEINVPQMTTNFQKNNSVFAYPETILRTEQASNNEDENVTQNSLPAYYNRPYSRAFNQQLGNQSLTYEEQTRKADPMFLFSERNVPQSTNDVIPNSQIISSGSPEIISQPEQNLHNAEKNESKILKTPYYNNSYQPFSRAFGSQLESSDHLLKENQFSNAISNNGAEINETPTKLYERTYENTLVPSLKTSNITSTQILQEDHILVKTDQISFPELDVTNKNAESDVLQMSKPLQKSLPQVPISEVSQGAPLPTKKERNEFQVFKEPYYNKNLEPFNSITINLQSSTENQLVRAESDINVKHNIIPYNMVIDESVSQMQPLSEFSPHIIQQNLTESPEDESLPILPTVNSYNLLDNNIEEGLPSTEPSIQLLFKTQENLPEFIQQIDVSENMRTKNAIATPVYNLGAKTKGTQSSHNGKLLENRDQTSKMSYFDRLNPSNSRGSIQEAAHYNQIINENKQIPKPNQNIHSQNTNNYNIPNNNEFSNKNEAQGPLLMPQQHNKKSLPIKYTLSSNSDDEEMDNKVTKSFGALDSKNRNPSYNGGIPGYDLQNTRVPYCNSFDPFISNTINKQTLHSSQRVKIKPTESLNQDLQTKENVNNTLHNDKGTESDSEALKINIPLQFQEKPQDPSTSDVFDNQGKAKVKNEMIQYSDTPEPITQQYAFSQDIRRVENESQANGIPFNNNPQPYNSNELNQQLSYDNQKKNEDTSSKLIITNQNTMPKLDININIPNYEDICKNIPVTITEKPNEACPGKINDNIAQNIIIDINNENENSCKCLNVSQKCDEITSIGDFIPCLTDESNVTKENDCTKTTVESSEFKEIIPSIDLNNFSSYLAHSILSAVQSFLVQPKCSSHNNVVAKNNFDIADIKNSVCNRSQIEIPLQNILEPVNNTNESALPLLNIQEESNHSAIKYQCPGTLRKDEVKTNTLLKGTPCLEPNLALQEQQSNKASVIEKAIVNSVTAIQYNKTEPDGMTKDSCICLNKTLQIPPHIDNNPYSDTSNPDGKVLETDSKTHIICTSTNKTRQVLQNSNENPSNVNTNEITTSHQSPQVLLPYYYYVDLTNVTSSDTEPIPKPIRRPSNTSEEEKSIVICQENDTGTTPTVIYDKTEEVERTHYGPKPCLSKITVNIMPIVDKSNHDILVFI